MLGGAGYDWGGIGCCVVDTTGVRSSSCGYSMSGTRDEAVVDAEFGSRK